MLRLWLISIFLCLWCFFYHSFSESGSHCWYSLSNWSTFPLWDPWLLTYFFLDLFCTWINNFLNNFITTVWAPHCYLRCDNIWYIRLLFFWLSIWWEVIIKILLILHGDLTYKIFVRCLLSATVWGIRIFLSLLFWMSLAGFRI